MDYIDPGDTATLHQLQCTCTVTVTQSQLSTQFGKIYGNFCEAQARVRQGSARYGPQGERPQSLNPCLELTLKLVVTHPPTTTKSLILLN